MEIISLIKRTSFGKIASFARNRIRSFKYLSKYAKIYSGVVSVSDIEVVSIEFCSICNLKCRYCFLEKKERPVFLDLSIYKKLLAEICGNKAYQIKIMEWPISGCFFLHPKYKEIIELTKEYKEKYPHFRPWVILNDNMMLFDRDVVDCILSQGVINQVICSIDGVDKETFEYMRPKAIFDKVLENTKYLLRKSRENESRLVIQVNNGRDASCASRRLDSGLREILRMADLVTFWEPLDWNESFHREEPRYAQYPSFCSFVFESVSLSTSGAVTKCCMDLKEATRYGDFNKDTLESIWSSEGRRTFLKAMHEGKRKSVPGCNTCSISYVSQNKFSQ